MAKTLLIKLAETVDNNKLPYLGEIRIGIKPISTVASYAANAHSQFFTVRANEPIPMEITGDGHFTDSTLTENLGKTYTMPAGRNTMYVSDGNSILSIRNKYAIAGFSMGDGNYTSDGTHFHWNVNLNDFMYMKSLDAIYLMWTSTSGDLSVFKTIQNMNFFLITSSYYGLTGDLSNLSHLTNLTQLNLFEAFNITGDISSIAGMTNLTVLDLGSCRNVTGDTSSIAALHPNNGGKLGSLNISGTQVTGTWPPSA